MCGREVERERGERTEEVGMRGGGGEEAELGRGRTKGEVDGRGECRQVAGRKAGGELT